jgi:hypothetical protein
LAAGLIALPWFVQTELSPASWSSWIYLNLAAESPEQQAFMSFVRLKILSAMLIVVTIACSSLRLLPARFSLRKMPLWRRTWPAFAASFLVLAVWFFRSVIPYSVPGFSGRGVAPEFRILHVEKRGIHFHETEVMAFRNGGVWTLRNDRRLIQYGFSQMISRSVMANERVIAFAQSPELWKLHTPPAKVLWSWNAEGWYVVLKETRLLAFTSEYRTTPPKEITDVFQEIDKLPTWQKQSSPVRDVCLGFCYDPLVALGFSLLQDRTRLLDSSR